MEASLFPRTWRQQRPLLQGKHILANRVSNDTRSKRLIFRNFITNCSFFQKIVQQEFIICICLGGDFNYFCSLPLPGKMIQFDEHIFQMGWLKPPTNVFQEFIWCGRVVNVFSGLSRSSTKGRDESTTYGSRKVDMGGKEQGFRVGGPEEWGNQTGWHLT